MKMIENRKPSRIKSFLRGVCWKMDSFLKWLRDHMYCYYDLEIDKIKEKVKQVHEQSEKFEAVEEIAPDILAALDELKQCNCTKETLQERLQVIEMYVTDLYVADMNNDIPTRRNIYDILIKYKFIK